MTERFIKLLDDEVYYLVDTHGLKTLNDFVEDIKEEYLEDGFTIDEINEIASENYNEYLYEHSMSANENLELLNNFNKGITDLIDSEPYWEQKAKERINQLEAQVTYLKKVCCNNMPNEMYRTVLKRLKKIEESYKNGGSC